MASAVDFLVACLVAHGATRVFGDPLGALPCEAMDRELAARFAAADGRLHRVGVAWDAPGAKLRISSRPGAATHVAVCENVRHIARVVESAVRDVARNHASYEIAIGFELDEPVPTRARPGGTRGYVPYPGSLASGEARVAVLAGPGVVRRAAVAGLHAFAAAANVGVANTFGAKGMFQWDSPHHMGTVGIQARDLELVFANIDIVITTGIDPDETRPPMPAHVACIPVEPRQLESLSGHVQTSVGIEPNPLYGALAAVAQPGYLDPRIPYHPARVVADLRARLSRGGLVVAPADPVGRWIARTFSTTELGSVVVPATARTADAAALAAVAALDGRAPILAVRVGEDSDAVAELAAWARGRGPDVEIVRWDGPETPIDWSVDSALRDAAGEFVF